MEIKGKLLFFCGNEGVTLDKATANPGAVVGLAWKWRVLTAQYNRQKLQEGKQTIKLVGMEEIKKNFLQRAVKNMQTI